ncbi:MAG: zinc metallopeptidase [Gemmatimonadota bacterium]
MTFYLIVGAVFLFTLLVQGTLRRTYAKWSRVRNSAGLPGSRVARTILNANEMRAVRVEPVRGKLSDHYDPRTKVIRLSEPIYERPSVASLAISAHESGHALQDHLHYGPLKLRTAVAPVANFAARFGIPALIGGALLYMIWLVQAGVVAYVGALLMQFLTLPVEFNASRRALSQLEDLALMSESETEGARKVLRAAAMTYVAGVASAAGYIVYLLLAGGRMILRKPPAAPPSIPPSGSAGI